MDEHELNKKRWQNRRRMTWLCLFSLLAMTGLLLFVIDIERIE